jgi:coenzyme F420 hydrogenase subunit beta
MMESTGGKHEKIGFDRLQRDVIGVGLCTACGTCIGVCPARHIAFDEEREEPVLKGKCTPCGICHAVCPGKDIPLPDLERMLFSRERKIGSQPPGISRRTLKGYATDPVVRKAGASGGCTTALLAFALESGMIDGAIVAGMSSEKPWRSEPKLATTREEILASARSKYNVVPNNALLMEAERRGLGRLGIAGLPCHVHGLRKLQMHGNPKGVASRITLVLGVFCGGNFSHKVSESIISKYTSIPLEKVKAYTDRGGPESQDIEVKSVDGTSQLVPVPKHALDRILMRRDRCAMCLDYSAELSDVSLGDIFMPLGSITKLPGFTAMIVRTKQGEALVEEARKFGRITVSPLKESGFRYNIGAFLKEHVVAHFLLERRRFGWPTPDFHYETRWEYPRYIDEKEAIIELMRDVPEIAEWISQKPALMQAIKSMDPEVLTVMEEILSGKKIGKGCG